MTPIERIARAGYEAARDVDAGPPPEPAVEWSNLHEWARTAWKAAARAIIAQTVKELDADDERNRT